MEQQLIEFNVERRSMPGGDPVEGELCRDVMISTEKPVRSGGGICKAGGAVLAAFLRNPVIMWAHGYRDPPIAKATRLTVEPGVGIWSRFEFPAPGIYPLADTVRGLWDGGFINAASIGFMPLEWEMIDDPESTVPLAERDKWDKIPVFNKWELYEFSLVSVPRDREALRRALELEDGRLEVGSWKLERPTSNVQLPAVDGRMLPGLDLQRFYDGLRAVREALCLK